MDRVRLVSLSIVSLLIFSLSPVSTADAHRRRTPRRNPPAVRVHPTDVNLDRLAMCESHMNPRAISRNGKYFGSFQFSLPTWRSVGRTGTPHAYTYEEQRESARFLVLRSGWRSQFPACSRRLGFR